MKLTRNVARVAGALVVLIRSAPVLAAAAQSPDGVWARDDGLVRARIGPCGGAVCAVNTWVRDPAGSEKIGDRLVMTMQRSSSGHWSGSAFDPQRNVTYSMEMSVEGERMTTRGCVLDGLVCRSVGWSRLSR
jgi:uncharacterized protein (DUF2147 family)